ncbi:MAG: DUF1810 domain-containing protein [Eggerthellaceae bacterium]|nr:DUF1810 domain-containing protein [Eggerthellaceae bacterium]
MKYADNDIQRFAAAQSNEVYDRALAEIRAGRKRGHWIWYIFPQVRGLGMSRNANYYGIGSWKELRAYVADDLLMRRLVEISQALLELEGNDPVSVLGGIDAVKVRSSMTLFELASDNPVFGQVLDKYYGGERDSLTLKLVKQFAE